jgi:hypothetical protein
MTARLCLIFKSLPDLQLEGKKLRAVIVLGFCILASAAQKTKSRGCSISNRGPFAKRAQPSILFAIADHGAGSGNLSFNSSMLSISNSLDPRQSQLQETFSGIGVEGRVHHGPAGNNTTALLPRFHLRCDEANVIHTCLVADVEHIRYRREVEAWIPFDEHDLLCPCSKNAFQLIQ